MSCAIQLILPWPPTMNTMYGRSAKTVFVRPDSRAYRKQVAGCVIEQLRRYPRLSGRLKVTYACNPPDLRVRDLDNLLKNLQDSLQHAGVWNDDGQIDEFTMLRDIPLKGGRIVVSIEELPIDKDATRGK